MPAQSSARALWGVQQAASDLRSSLMRIDPNSCDQHPDRALLHGLGILLQVAEQTHDGAKANMTRLIGKTSAHSSDGTPRHKDPRVTLREQLTRTADLAKKTYGILDGHRKALESHRNAMHLRFSDLELVHRILEKTVEDESTHGLSKSAPCKPSTSCRTTPTPVKGFLLVPLTLYGM